jgi:hypothetical protein
MGATCTECGELCGSDAGLMEHMARAHKNGGPSRSVEQNPEAHTPGVLCMLCGRRFTTPQALAQHNLSPHRGADAPWEIPAGSD